ncbi:Wzz/FepE/Etk N-terminal domain-containing protein [Halalkalibaculum sp. DA384]|uniref:Wzz/FepE/Etk N-terminal domain-containing protein n=1 Tax=Halalkalibaculum sp. DA384 TaxID=3373606 RepID=UPI0037551AD7
MSKSDSNTGKRESDKEKKSNIGPLKLVRSNYRLVPVDEYQRFLQWSERQIDTTALFNRLWEKRIDILKYAAVAGVAGLMVTFLMKPEYTAKASLMPEYSTERSLGGNAQELLQQYGDMLGFTGGTYASRSNAIRVELYPQIVYSLPFQLDLLEQEFYYPEHDTTAPLFIYFNTLRTYSLLDYIYAYTIALPFTAKAWLEYWLFENEQGVTPVTGRVNSADPGILNISKEQMQIIAEMQFRVRSSLDPESGIVHVQATMPDPRLAAQVTQYAIERLTQHLTEYRTQKIKMDLNFITEQYQNARQQFRSIQDSLATFRDRNQHIATARAENREQVLEYRYTLSRNLYDALAQQREQAKLRLQEETPVFEILDPVQVPLEKSSPQRLKVLLIGLFLGALVGIGFVGFRIYAEGQYRHKA